MVSLFRDNMLTTNTYAENYSEKGMYIKTNGAMYPKESILEIVFPDKKGKFIRVLARVVHRNLDGIGVEFE